MSMEVIKRSGEKEPVAFDKITARINKLCYALDKTVAATVVAQKVITGVYDGVTTIALDHLAAETHGDHLLQVDRAHAEPELGLGIKGIL